MSVFAFRDVEHQLEIVDRRATTFRSEHTFVIEALVPSRFFPRTYFWTGSGVEKEQVPEVISDIDAWGLPKQRIHGPLIVEGSSRTLIVDLGRTIEKKEKETVKFRHKMRDLNGTFEPRLGVHPSTQVKNRIELRVIIPDWTDLRVRYQTFTHEGGKTVHSEDLSPYIKDERLTFVKEILKPRERNLGHRIVWTHKEG